MKLYQVINGFIHSLSNSSLLSITNQVENMNYQELTAFFKEEYLTQDIINSSKEVLFSDNSGKLMFDEIVLLKSKRGTTKIVKRRYKSTGGYIVPGVSIILLVWVQGDLRFPIRFKLRNNDENITESTLELLSWFRNKVKKKPESIVFDSGFPSYKILKRINDYGWTYVCRIPKSRKFNGKQIWKNQPRGYWNEIGYLSKGLKVKAVRRKNKFYITNRLTLKANDIVKIYSQRAIIEEIFRVLKQECHWSKCHLTDEKAYERFYIVGILCFISLEYNRINTFNQTIYKIRRQAIFNHLDVYIPDFDSILELLKT
jgi:hypothetical protein